MLADEAPAEELTAVLDGTDRPGPAVAAALADAGRVRTAGAHRPARAGGPGAAADRRGPHLAAPRRRRARRDRRPRPPAAGLRLQLHRARRRAHRGRLHARHGRHPDTRAAPGPAGDGLRRRRLRHPDGRPLATSDYLNDERIRHDPHVAAAVAADAVVSIAGVPMTSGGAVIGALFAADRHHRTFDQDEIALLASLAAHAAIVIENARLFERVQADSAGLRAANARLDAHREALERAARAHEELMPMALRRAGLDEFATAVAALLDAGVSLVGVDGSVLAEAGAALPAAGAGAAREVTVQAGHESFGTLRVHRAAPFDDGDARIVERAAQTAALLVLMRRQTDGVARELRAELVADLVGASAADPDVLQRRAARLGVLDPGRAHCVVVVVGGTLPRRTLLAAAADLADDEGGLAGEQGGLAVLVLPDADAGRRPAGSRPRCRRRPGHPWRRARTAPRARSPPCATCIPARRAAPGCSGRWGAPVRGGRR
ncbi:GAF domain-containing protein [Pseudonocardia benzenivorans]